MAPPTNNANRRNVARAMTSQALNVTAASSAGDGAPAGQAAAAHLSGVFGLLTALTADVVAWCLSEAVPPALRGHGPYGSGSGAASTTAAATYWHRGLGAELLWRLLEAWQLALVTAARAQAAWADRFSAQYALLAANAVGDGVVRAIRATLSAAPAAASASAAAGDGSGAASSSSSSAPLALPSTTTGAFMANTASVARAAVQRAALLNSIQAAAGALQACLWAASALLPRAAEAAAASADLQQASARPLVSLPEVLLAGAAVLALAPHPLRLVLRE
jgi:hypothetical protein